MSAADSCRFVLPSVILLAFPFDVPYNQLTFPNISLFAGFARETFWPIAPCGS
jgi:hypothetical protein